jgi:hypothetical protein
MERFASAQAIGVRENLVLEPRRVFLFPVLTAVPINRCLFNFTLLALSSAQERRASDASAEALEKKARAASNKSAGGKVHQSPPLRPDDKVSFP